MPSQPPPRVAFLGWNAFQLLHGLDIARALPGSILVVERRPEHLDELSDSFLSSLEVPVLFWEPERMAELDGVFDVVVCQTPFTQIERFEKSKIAMLQYELAKKPHNYNA